MAMGRRVKQSVVSSQLFLLLTERLTARNAY